MQVSYLAGLVLSLFLSNVGAAGHCDEQFGMEVDLFTKAFSLSSAGVTPPTTQWFPVRPGSFFYQSKAIIPLPSLSCGEGLQLSAWVSFTVDVNGGSEQDPQNGFGLLGLVSPDEGWNFSFWILNTRVYALFARYPNGQTASNYYQSAAYLIPIANRQIGYTDLYEIWLDPGKRRVSWRMNNYEILSVGKPGKVLQVDPRFQIGDYGGFFEDCDGFPSKVVAQIGLGRPTPVLYTGVPFTACEGNELFNNCCDSLHLASNVHCSYNPATGVTSFPLGAAVAYEDISVSRLARAVTCPIWSCQFGAELGACEEPAFEQVVCNQPVAQCFPRVNTVVVQPEQPFLPWLRRGARTKKQ